MTARPGASRNWLAVLRFSFLGTAIAVMVSVALNYLLLFIHALDPFERSLVAAFIIPLVVATPLLVMLSVSRAELRSAKREMTRLASTDRVTSCLDGSVFSTLVDRRMASQPTQGCAFVVVDIEHLRTTIATYGPHVGDEAQSMIAAIIQSTVRKGDLVSRISDGKFGILLQNTDETDAARICSRIRDAVSRVYFAPAGQPVNLTASVMGVSIDAPANYNELYRAAHSRTAHSESLGEALPRLSVVH